MKFEIGVALGIDKNKTIFLLGGHDLEMLTIKKHLLVEGFEEEINLFDHKLTWGAKLSAYEELLTKHSDKTIYGIELTEDCTPPSNYLRIDHHNDFSDNDASLLQVLQLLNKEASHEDKLVIANDVGHIEAMKCMGATEREIKRIRQEERTIAGVSQEDEVKALEEIKTVEVNNGVHIIKTSLNSFSPIVDNYRKRPLLVYSQKSLTYYGDITFLKENYKEQIEKNEAYHGRGYFGFDSKYVGSISLNTLVKEMVSLKEKKLHSYHTFMFPFIFRSKDVKNDKDWSYKKFETDSQKAFNEKVYFYKHVQDALFNEEKEDEQKFISKYYEYVKKEGTFTINTCPKGNYELELDGISLRVFNTGVAILAINLKNNDYADIEDVLAINDFGRRTYPQFLGADYILDTKQALLADSIEVVFKGEEPIVENFKNYNKESIIKGVQLPAYIDRLIGKSFQNIQHVIDDRMFVLSQYHNDELVNKMKNYNVTTQEYCYEDDDSWYQYMFIDGNGKNCQSKHMTKKLITNSTYDRWVEWGTLFGVTRYSFVTLTGSWFGENRLLPHMQTMYFQMFSLLLAYRATIIKFADDIQEVTQEESEEIFEKTSKLYKNYLDFLNQLYFKEVTAQDQGIELYEKAVEIMRIETFLQDLDNEISELHQYVQMLDEKEQNKRLGKISELGAVFLPPTLLAGIYGANIFDFSQKEGDLLIGLGAMGMVALLSFASLKVKNPLSKIALVTAIPLVMVGSVFIIGEKSSETKIENKVVKIIKDKNESI